MRERVARWTLIAFAATTLLVLGGGAGAAERPGGAAANGGGGASYSVTLITGDQIQLEVFPDGRQAATIDPAPRGDGLPEPGFQTLQNDGDLYVIPSDAAPYLDSTLDRRLFNLTELVAQGLQDEASASLPVIVDYDRTVGTLPPALNRVDTLQSIDAAAAREPRAKAAAFGRALAVQARSDASGRSGARAAAGPGLFAGIDKIWLDEQVKVTLEDSVPQIGAPTAWAAGYDGAGIKVAVLDTGIDATHPDLLGKVVTARNFTDSPTETDRFGHGTHVASIVAGSGAASAGLRKGVAPGATLVSGKVIGDNGLGLESWVIAGMEWAARDEGAKVVNMSLASGITDGTDPASQAVNNLTEQYGTLFAVAAGNFGGQQNVSAPGAASSALTVGAVSKADVLASFSSRGPRRGDFAIKPDVTAPGVDIAAARAAGTSIGTPIDAYYTRASGTSMATPHVAGAAALLAERHPDWTAGELKSALVTTSSPGPYTIYEQGSGRIDVARAFTQPTVLATPAPLNLGYFRWPHEGRAPVTKTVTYSNVSDTEVTLAVEIAGAGGTPIPAGMLTVSPQLVTLAPGAAKDVAVTLDTTVGTPGLYGAYLVARDQGAGVVVRTPVGFYKESERYDLTVVGIDRDGQPATGAQLDVFNVDDRRLFDQTSIPFSDRLTVRVPPGHYSVFLGKLFGAWLVGDPELTVTRDTQIVLDVREANPTTVEVEDFDTLPVSYRFGYYRIDPNGRATGHIYTSSQGSRPLFVGSTKPVTVGSFEYYTKWRLTGPDPATSPYLFDLVFPEPGHIPHTLHYAIDAGAREHDLAALPTSYYGQVAPGHQLEEVRHTWRPWELISAATVLNVPTPLVRTEYVTANDNRWQQQVYFAHPTSAVMQEPRTRYQGGQRIERTWWKQPAHPSLLEGNQVQAGVPVVRRGDVLVVQVPEWGDANGGHWGDRVTGIDATAFRLFRDGELVAAASRAFGSFPMAAEPATYRLELDVSRAAEWWQLSTHTATAWTIRSERPTTAEAVLPLLLVDYGLNLDLLNRALLPQERRGPQVLDFTVRHQPGANGPPVAGLRLSVSFDDGATWKEKQVRARGGGRFQAILDQRDFDETSGFVSLKVDAWDAGGDRIEQEITRAYALQPR